MKQKHFWRIDELLPGGVYKLRSFDGDVDSLTEISEIMSL